MDDLARESRETEVFDSRTSGAIRLAPGVVLAGRYQLEGELGRGGMGIVFRAIDRELERAVAVKVVPEGAASSEARDRLLREARAAAALNHPHIVSVYDVGEHHGMPFFVMELIVGLDLSRQRPADTAEAIEIALQLCDALDHAHAHGLVHRDLKPANVLLASNGQRHFVKLADLGLAVASSASRLSQAGMVVGTPHYMPPEQAMGESVDGRADLYSLGVMLYELATGRLPFTGDHPLAIVSQHVHAPVVPPRAIRPDLPQPLEAAILKLMAKSPTQRFGTAAEVAVALRASRDAPSAAPTGPAESVALLDALARGRLVARTDEIAELRELWRRARAATGHGVFLSGEPGAGKTRLARELTIQAAIDGATVLTGGCYEYEATTPYLPFVEAFRKWVRDQRDDDRLRATLGDDAAQIAKLAPDVEARIGPFPARTELPAHEERLLFFDAVAAVLIRFAGERGLLLHLDDLHWADASTLWLLAHLLRKAKTERILVLGAYREIELDRAHPLARALVDWNRERLTTRIVLRRFVLEETRNQLAALLGQTPSVEFAEQVFRETDGNPFFVEEVLKSLIDQGSIRRTSGRWERSGDGVLRIPQSVKEAIGHRLSRVGEVCNEILRTAAVLGKTFEFADLAAAVEGRGEDALLDALDEAVAAQLLVAGRGDAFAFTHDKIREVLYEELNPVRRRRVHRRIAEALAAKGSGSAETLAHHFLQAGDHERGLEHARRAAQAAERLSAFVEAIAAYGLALECAEALQRLDERIALEEAMGRASVAAGDNIPAVEHFEAALALASEPLQRARLQCAAAAALVTTGEARGLQHLEAALAVLDPATHPRETASALATQARFHHLACAHRRASEILRQAAEIAEGAPESGRDHGVVLGLIYGYCAGAYQHLGEFRTSNDWARKAVVLGQRHALAMAESLGLEFLGENAINTGEWAAGVGYADAERAIAERIHSRERLGWCHYVAAMNSHLAGDWTRARREFDDGVRLAEAIGEKRLAPLLRGSLATLEADAGQLDAALATAGVALDQAEATGLLYMRTDARRSLAYVHLKRGELEAAIARAEEVVTLTEGTDARVARLWVGPTHVAALITLGRLDEAEQRLAAYERMVAECHSPRFEAEAQRLRRELGEASS